MVKCFNPDVVAVGKLLKQLFPVCTGAFCFDLFFFFVVFFLFVFLFCLESPSSFYNKNDQSSQQPFNVFFMS